jgi:hypothetical protein
MRIAGCVLSVDVLAFLGAALIPLWADDEEKVPLDKLPKAVTEAVKKRFPDAELQSAEKEKEGDKTVFEVGIKNKGQKIDVTVTEDGKVVEIEKEIEAKSLPKAVSETLEKKYPKATYKTIEEVIKVKDGKDEPAYYEVLLVTSDNKKLEVSLSADGKVTEEEDKSKEKDKKEEKPRG